MPYFTGLFKNYSLPCPYLRIEKACIEISQYMLLKNNFLLKKY